MKSRTSSHAGDSLPKSSSSSAKIDCNSDDDADSELNDDNESDDSSQCDPMDQSNSPALQISESAASVQSDSEVEFVHAQVASKPSGSKPVVKKSLEKKTKATSPSKDKDFVTKAKNSPSKEMKMTPTKNDKGQSRVYMDWAMGTMVKLYDSGHMSPARLKPGPASFQVAYWPDGSEEITEIPNLVLPIGVMKKPAAKKVCKRPSARVDEEHGEAGTEQDEESEEDEEEQADAVMEPELAVPAVTLQVCKCLLSCLFVKYIIQQHTCLSFG